MIDLMNSILRRIDFEIDMRNVKIISNKQLKIMNQCRISCNRWLIKSMINNCKYQNSVKILIRCIRRKRSDSEKCSKDSKRIFKKTVTFNFNPLILIDDRIMMKMNVLLHHVLNKSQK